MKRYRAHVLDVPKTPEVFAGGPRRSLGALGVVSTIALRCVPAFTCRGERADADSTTSSRCSTSTSRGTTTSSSTGSPTPNGCRPSRTTESRALPSRAPGEGVVQRGVPRERSRSRSLGTSSTARPVNDPDHLASAHEGDHARRVYREVVQGVRHAAARALLRDGVRRARAAVSDCLRELRSFIDSSGLLIQVPVEVRFVAADDIPLSMAAGRDERVRRVPRLRGSGVRAVLPRRRAHHGSARADGPTGGSSTSRPPRRSRRAIPSGPVPGRAATRSTPGASSRTPISTASSADAGASLAVGVPETFETPGNRRGVRGSGRSRRSPRRGPRPGPRRRGAATIRSWARRRPTATSAVTR